jgi:hypothetical protein
MENAESNHVLLNFAWEGRVARESEFQTRLIRKLRRMFPGCIILRNDANYLQGVPDILILWGNRWAVLEVKRNPTARTEPNQVHYVKIMNNMSFADFIYPENEEQVLRDLQRALGATRQARVPDTE